ncbi:TetR/AcrR family transcriptional regulator [Saccharothrix hoggarensis]|uniref:TetR/AcrR family transcriptional regulator n=1 Tax=Saccharothrix hoggarensis TaxID=913853 RepID=A0ABW3QU79_9PSEU
MRRSAAQTREHVLGIAHELFYWNGIHAIGVDRVAAEAGVAPTTLYRLFRSKDDLVGAYVERADHYYRAWFSEATKDDGRDPRDRILAAFDELIVQVDPAVCRGCPFLMALAEFPDPELPAHRNAVATKAWMRARFGELAGQLGVAEPDALADQLALVMEGVYASVQALGIDGPARQARDLVELLLPDRASEDAVGAEARRGAPAPA